MDSRHVIAFLKALFAPANTCQPLDRPSETPRPASLLNEDQQLSTPKLGVSTLSSRRKALPCLSRSVTTLVTATSSTLRHHGLLPPRLALIPLVIGSEFDARAGVQGYEHRGSPDQPSPGLTG
ncbi:hypothetical protein CRG98_042357 [Punica granatum]|uniref:Uncharacterized protein n=1 Tax=Punica granatum TaxID=22663 RepID=A0A2I0HZX4_PUNGR|nr:hypothetical protein CRG98_042357 [Punica granatum]